MNINGARLPVAGATGVPGGARTAEPAGLGAVADATEADTEVLRTTPDGTPVADRRSR